MKNFKRLFIILITICLAFGLNSQVFAQEKQYYVGGFPLGFDLTSNGALVVGLSEVVCEDGIFLPAKDAGIKSGDYIISLNGKKIITANDIDKVLKSANANEIIAEVLSGDELSIKKIYPKKDLSGNYKIGVLIRDYLSGIGTVTIIDENGTFASLGHPIVDEQGGLLNVGGGIVYGCKILGIIKGERGKAGELSGTIVRSVQIGEVTANSNVGLIGKINNNDLIKKLKKLPIGEPEPGNAQVYTTISGQKTATYSISIIKVIDDKNNKDLVVKINDEKLIKNAGGIVQGMSGSPIIQNGKIVGAITHVFLNDSTRGYGINIKKMVDFMDNL